MAMVYLETFQVTQNPFYEKTAREIFSYVLRDMTDFRGGFYSAEDADSEGVEGLFYVWTPKELIEVLGEEDGALAARWYGVVAGGNFSDEAGGDNPGHSLLHQPRTLEAMAEVTDMEPDELAARIESIRKRLFTHREPRIHPLKDDKILTDWNGLMIAAFSLGARALNDAEYRDVAKRAADHLLSKLRDDKGRLYKLTRLGVPSQSGMVEDYSFAIWGLIELYEACFEERYLKAALELQDTQLAHFWDQKVGGMYVNPDDGDVLITRPKDAYDGAIPSGNSVAAYNLVRLARLSGRTHYEERCDELIRAFSGQVALNPSNFTQMMVAVDFISGPTHELVIAAGKDPVEFEQVRSTIMSRFLPNVAVIVRPQGDDPAIGRLAPFAAAQVSRDDKTTLYLCQDFACQAPTHDVDEVLKQLVP
ncbi:MAG: hypothetical protein ACI841_002670 [Planctomycetota bacterium]|jgi:uncharacterized protein YyaL (SSP411 family)